MVKTIKKNCRFKNFVFNIFFDTKEDIVKINFVSPVSRKVEYRLKDISKYKNKGGMSGYIYEELLKKNVIMELFEV
jgi:uncharacterized membrane protein